MTTRGQDQLAQLYRDHHHAVHAFITRRFGADIADDALGATWATLARIGTGRLEPGMARAFLRRVAWHEALKVIRHGAPRGHQAPDSLDATRSRGNGDVCDDRPHPDPHADTERQALDRLELADTLDAIGHLSRGQQVTLIGRIIGLTYDEIGHAGGHPTSDRVRQQGHANTWANRGVREGRKQLRRELAGRWD